MIASFLESCCDGGKHLPENMGDKPFEVVLIEMKSK